MNTAAPTFRTDLTRKQILKVCDCLNARAKDYENCATNIALGAIKGDRVVMQNAAGECRAISQRLLGVLGVEAA